MAKSEIVALFREATTERDFRRILESTSIHWSKWGEDPSVDPYTGIPYHINDGVFSWDDLTAYARQEAVEEQDQDGPYCQGSSITKYRMDETGNLIKIGVEKIDPGVAQATYRRAMSGDGAEEIMRLVSLDQERLQEARLTDDSDNITERLMATWQEPVHHCWYPGDEDIEPYIKRARRHLYLYDRTDTWDIFNVAMQYLLRDIADKPKLRHYLFPEQETQIVVLCELMERYEWLFSKEEYQSLLNKMPRVKAEMDSPQRQWEIDMMTDPMDRGYVEQVDWDNAFYTVEMWEKELVEHIWADEYNHVKVWEGKKLRRSPENEETMVGIAGTIRSHPRAIIASIFASMDRALGVEDITRMVHHEGRKTKRLFVQSITIDGIRTHGRFVPWYSLPYEINNLVMPSDGIQKIIDYCTERGLKQALKHVEKCLPKLEEGRQIGYGAYERYL